jgi:oxygen-dependent protoporphyrinogen oxidase
MRVVVAGAGITGLAAAFTLQREAARLRRELDLVVLDVAPQAGGHARTLSEAGFLVEQGPNGFLAERGNHAEGAGRGEETLALVEELGLCDRLVEANPSTRRRLILTSGKLREVPASPAALVTSDAIGWRGKLRMLGEPWAPGPPVGTDETVFDFAERRLGREAAERFVDTAVAGISGGDSRLLSVRSQFPLLKELEDRHGSLVKGVWARRGQTRGRLTSFDGGIGTLTGALASRLTGAGALRLNCRIDRVEKTASSWRVHPSGGASIEADHFICALPSHAAARIVAGFDGALSESLASIPYAGMAVVALAYRADDLENSLHGYGYLVTRAENLATLGVLWETSIFSNRAPAGHVLLRAILGGARRPDVSALAESSCAELAVREAAGVLGISGSPLRQWVWRWPSAIAQYTVGHQARTAEIARLAAAHRGLHICGTAYDGVACNDGIAAGRRVARAVAGELAPPIRRQDVAHA